MLVARPADCGPDIAPPGHKMVLMPPIPGACAPGDTPAPLRDESASFSACRQSGQQVGDLLVHEGRVVAEGPTAEVRGAAADLEDAFLSLVASR